MNDREKVIQHFENAIEVSGNNTKWRFVRVDIIKDALKLLKADRAYLLMLQLKGKRLPTWNEVYHAIND